MKRKEPHDGKNLPIPTPQKSQQDFCVHAALGRLRFVSGSTAQLHYLIDFSITGTGVRVKIWGEKSVRVRVRAKFTRVRARDWDLKEQQAQQVYVHLQKNGACHTGVTCRLASTSGVATHRKNGVPGCLPERHFSFWGVSQTLSLYDLAALSFFTFNVESKIFSLASVLNQPLTKHCYNIFEEVHQLDSYFACGR